MASDPSHGWTKFSGFLLAHSLKLADASRGLRVSKATITHWRTGTPDGLRRRAIAVWTRGEVNEKDWDTAEEAAYLAAIVATSPRSKSRKKKGTRRSSVPPPALSPEERTLPLPFDVQTDTK